MNKVYLVMVYNYPLSIHSTEKKAHAAGMKIQKGEEYKPMDQYDRLYEVLPIELDREEGVSRAYLEEKSI